MAYARCCLCNMLAVLVAMLRRLRAVELRLQALQCLLDCLCCNRLAASFLGDKQVYVLPCHRPRSIVVTPGRVVVRSTEACLDGCRGSWLRNKTRLVAAAQAGSSCCTPLLINIAASEPVHNNTGCRITAPQKFAQLLTDRWRGIRDMRS